MVCFVSCSGCYDGFHLVKTKREYRPLRYCHAEPGELNKSISFMMHICAEPSGLRAASAAQWVAFGVSTVMWEVCYQPNENVDKLV